MHSQSPHIYVCTYMYTCGSGGTWFVGSGCLGELLGEFLGGFSCLVLGATVLLFNQASPFSDKFENSLTGQHPKGQQTQRQVFTQVSRNMKCLLHFMSVHFMSCNLVSKTYRKKGDMNPCIAALKASTPPTCAPSPSPSCCTPEDFTGAVMPAPLAPTPSPSLQPILLSSLWPMLSALMAPLSAKA